MICNPNDVLEFIDDFLNYQSDELAYEVLHTQFRSGYCYHFAQILRYTFHRGTVCWAAPFGHIVWKDIDGNIYDIEGLYDGEAFYFIPLEYIGMAVRDFMRINSDDYNGTTKSELINIIKLYCKETGTEYIDSIEDYFLKEK